MAGGFETQRDVLRRLSLAVLGLTVLMAGVAPVFAQGEQAGTLKGTVAELVFFCLSSEYRIIPHIVLLLLINPKCYLFFTQKPADHH